MTVPRHQTRGGLGRKKGGAQVQVHDHVVGFGIYFQERLRSIGASVVHKDLEGWQFPQHGGQIIAVGDINGQYMRSAAQLLNLLGDGYQIILIAPD